MPSSQMEALMKAHLKQFKESHDRALNARLTPFIIRVIYDTNSYGDYKELYPLPEWTMLRFKREVLQLFGLLHGNYTKPDKNYTFATYFGNEAFLNNSKRVKSCLGLQCVVSLCPKRAAPVPEMPVAITDNEATQADAHSSTSGSDDDNDKGHASDASLDSDDVSISEFIKLPDGYADEWTDSEGEEDEGDIMAPTIWVDVKEFNWRNVALFRGVSVLITTQELKAMIEYDITRKLPSSSSEKTLGVDDFVLKCNNYKMENDNEIGDYLDSNNQDKLEAVLHLTLRGGAPRANKQETKPKVKTMSVLEKKKLRDANRQKMKACEITSTPAFVESNRILTETWAQGERDAVSAFQQLIEHLDIDQLKCAQSAIANRAGGDSAYKLNKVSDVLYGANIATIKDVKDVATSVMECASLTTNALFEMATNQDSKFEMNTLRAMVDKMLVRKEGFQSGYMSAVSHAKASALAQDVAM
ncbi:unnamed protein product [Effrenium voratum]|nr:unnamed protein product [Effrenium voratum]